MSFNVAPMCSELAPWDWLTNRGTVPLGNHQLPVALHLEGKPYENLPIHIGRNCISKLRTSMK